MSLKFAIRSIIVAAIAAAVAGLPAAALLTIGLDAELRLLAVSRMMLLSLGGGFFIRLPLAILIFRVTKSDREFGFGKLALVANGVAIILIALLAAWSGWFGVVFFGLPSLLAANAFMVFGWFLVLKPYRIGRNA